MNTSTLLSHLQTELHDDTIQPIIPYVHSLNPNSFVSNSLFLGNVSNPQSAFVSGLTLTSAKLLGNKFNGDRLLASQGLSELTRLFDNLFTLIKNARNETELIDYAIYNKEMPGHDNIKKAHDTGILLALISCYLSYQLAKNTQHNTETPLAQLALNNINDVLRLSSLAEIIKHPTLKQIAYALCENHEAFTPDCLTDFGLLPDGEKLIVMTICSSVGRVNVIRLRHFLQNTAEYNKELHDAILAIICKLAG